MTHLGHISTVLKGKNKPKPTHRQGRVCVYVCVCVCVCVCGCLAGRRFASGVACVARSDALWGLLLHIGVAVAPRRAPDSPTAV